MAALVGIVMGSESDRDRMRAAEKVLDGFGVAYESEVMSAHRQPRRVADYSRTAEERGLGVLIAGAGMSAHLPGVLAAYTVLPVIGVPLYDESLSGAAALYSCVQMPPGVPVAAVAIDGAKNAAVLAVQMLAVADDGLRSRLHGLKKDLEEGHRL
jgi:5-(carboxyamino)imidazole ribonucleotide mutase